MQKTSSEDVSLELVYVGWIFGDMFMLDGYFGDCHYDNFRVIVNYNSSYIKFHFFFFFFFFFFLGFVFCCEFFNELNCH
jgi:hypothetical protein